MNKLIFYIAIFLLASSFYIVHIGNGTEGIATDSIARISYGGLIWPTWRVQLLNDHPIQGNQMNYGIRSTDTELIQELQHYAETGQRVKLFYRSVLFSFIWDYSDSEVIYKVEPVG